MDLTYSLTKKLEKTLKKLETRQSALVRKFEEKRDAILQTPTLGYPLKENLRPFWSYDWTINGIAVRLCYLYDPTEQHIYFVWFGTRENFYDDVKQYLSSVNFRL
ncbi:type II toxin-antitoxin system RelE/ParE family toxin [Brevibacillus centrosporus]|uniref:ParE-like toxin of type II toxin-antitoxin system n=3 Tax=Brevibacillus centrosporus TaxID=54910 RepID=A0A1I3MEN5_9BACL|nr:type II toxin-antitoxin system RelE/ParE family toxin [Brevibacillus centrosporus]MEC2130090.1 type II toxin-antitoxin system RelE/ParE family toxin [Brevibacillus centrosporus]RNB65268.1 addiction module antitoxin [Brevibacillus centrosporus]GED33703.1 hypothetical protein BCE02nite_48440 [Brevibacillus centrosporus]SFI95156.1 ParE-like toxin of type II toxin-antitoxin system [Brevibacillus centrosporus]